MKKIILIEESLLEFSKGKRGRKRKDTRDIDATDSFEDTEDADDEEDLKEPEDVDIESEDEVKELENIDTSDMSDAEEIDVEEDVVDDTLVKILTSEIDLPEINRGELIFHLKGDAEKILRGVPMAKLSKQNAFVFKLENGSLKKILLKDIVLEDVENLNNEE